MIKPDKTILEQDYKRLKSCEAVAKIYGCGRTTVYNWLKSYGIEIIPMSGRKLSPEHREKVIKTLRPCQMTGRRHSEETKAKMSRDRKGSGNANYKGGVTEEIRKFRRTKEYIAWRNAVIRRSGGICEMCGEKKTLEAHHIISVHKNRDLALDVNNGKALCYDCHKLADKRGVKNAKK